MRRAFVASTVIVLAAAMPARTQQADEVDRTTVRARMHVYLSKYETELSTLIAEELLVQWPHNATGLGYRDYTGVRRDFARARTLVSDVAFVSLPGQAGWLGYRDVRTINKKPVKRSGLPLEELLKVGSDDSRERAMALLLEGARYNLGAPRTINLPSLPLELLHIRNQGRFVIIGSYRDRVGTCDAVRLDFEETVRPTLIQRPDGGNMPSKVAAWIEPTDGTLCQAEVRTKDAQLGALFEAVVRVGFRPDSSLGLMVPSTMYEVFFDPPRNKGEGEATYSNYRRFTTSGRLVPPGAPDRR